MKRRLTLRSEHLSELTSTELNAVAAGTLTGVYPTVQQPCRSVQVCIEVAPIPTLQDECPTQRCFTGTTGYTFTCN